MKYLGALVVWFLLVLVGAAGLVTGLLSLLLLRTDYISRVFKMHDRTAAAVLGWPGDKTVSYECGRSTCLFCRIMCPVVGFLLHNPDHCTDEAK